ncbi:MAG: MAPEG family protein [Steroidobacteraceae bacterium]
MPIVTALYAGLLGLLAVAVAFPVGMMRGKLNISVGDGGNPALLLAMRRHANFAEWVPLALILIALLELNGVSPRAIHALGATLVVARLLHAFGLKSDTMQSIGRGLGAMATALITVTASVWLLVLFIGR